MKQTTSRYIWMILFSMMMIIQMPLMSYADDHELSHEMIFENHQSIMMVIDSETGQIIDANAAAEDFYGYSRAELIQMNINEINTLNSTEIKAEMQDALTEKRNYFEFKHRLKDGTVRDVEVYSSPVDGESNNKLLFSVIHDITEKKLAEKAVETNRLFIIGTLTLLILVLLSVSYFVNKTKVNERNEKEKFKALFDNMNEGFAFHEIILDDAGNPVDYRFLEVNKAFEDITGLKLSQIKNQTAKTMLPGLEDYWIQAYGAVALTGKPVTLSNYSSELEKHFSVNVYCPFPGQFVTLFTDITFSVEAQEKIEHERQLLEMILEDTLSGYWDFDFKNKIFYFSPSFKSMFGYNVDESLSLEQVWQHLLYKEDQTKLNTLYQSHIDSHGKIPFYSELRYHHRNGATLWVICSGRVVEWEGDQAVRMVGCHIDITQRKQLERMVNSERTLFKTTLHSIGDGVISTDKFGNIVIMNHVAEYLTGWTNQESHGKPLESVFQVVDEFSHMSVKTIINEVRDHDLHVMMDDQVQLTRKTGDVIPIEMSMSPIKDEINHVNGMVIVFSDCTEKKEKQEKIKYLSYHDRLTGLYNRHFFEEELKRLNTERNLPLSLAMLDVNGLKLTNDAFDHEMGDLLLKKVAELLKRECRSGEVIARIGGDEFVILLPKTSEVEARLISERIIKAVDQETFETVVISVSIGLETRTTLDQSIEEVFSAAEDNMYRHKLTESQSMKNRTIRMLIETLYGTNETEKIHSERVSEIAVEIGRLMGFPEDQIKELEVLGLMHDIGKIAINSDILNKPGQLTQFEYEEIKKHPEISYHILKAADTYSKIADGVLSHHERWDGLGYPRGISGAEIPITSRILAVADAYEAMTANRPYRKALSPEKALLELKRCSASQFDPQVVEIFETYFLKKVLVKHS